MAGKAEEYFKDVMASVPPVPDNIKEKVSDYVDQATGFLNVHVEKASGFVREQLATQPWVPEFARPIPPPPPPAPEVIETLTRWEATKDWFARNKYLIAFLTVATGVVAYKAYTKSQSVSKIRRARRAENGGRIEVIIIAGSPTLPLTRSLSMDLERKGFIVYIVCSSIEEEMMVQNLSRPDVRPLSMDITNPPHGGTSIEKFAQYMQTPHAPVPKAKPTYLSLNSIILIPSLNYHTSPIATIPPSAFSNLFNTHLLHPIMTIQAFLPLLTARLNPSTDRPKVLVFTPSIISSINPPFHAPEATVCSALSAFTDVLAGELGPLNISVSHVKLGTFDFSHLTPGATRLGLESTSGTGFQPQATGSIPMSLPPPTDVAALAWPEGVKAAFGENYVASARSSISAGRIKGLRGSSLKSLHTQVFDIIDGSDTRSVVRVGLGADMYGFVGHFVPRNIVRWMMGVRPVEEIATWNQPKNEVVEDTEEDDEEESGDEEDTAGSEKSGFVAVEGEHGANVWRETPI